MTVLATAPSGADAPNFDEVTIELETFPSTENFTLHQFDSEGGTLVLDEVTITATVDADVDGTLQNLSQSVTKTLTALVDASIELNGTGVSGLSAGASDSETFILSPQEEVDFVLTDTGEAVATITDAGQLEAFVGDDVLPYSVTGLVETTVSGPAPYLSTGGANGSATVRIDYESVPVGDPVPKIDLVKDNDADGDTDFTDVETAPAEGAAVPFEVVITNTGETDLTITDLDDVFEGTTIDLLAAGLCDQLDGATLPVGASETCTFTLTDYAPAPGSLENTVTVTGQPPEGDPVTADDPSTVIVEEPPSPVPDIDLVKTNDADGDTDFTDVETAPAEGAAVPFEVVITNTGETDLTITKLEDVFNGTTVDLLAPGLCDQLDGATLPVGADPETCTFTLTDYAPATGDSPLVNTVTVTGEDPEGTPVTANDPSTVIVEESPPPPECVAVPGKHKGNIDGLNVDLKKEGGTFNLKDGGTITITITEFKEGEGVALDWTSTVGIAWFSIKAGKADHVTEVYNPPAFSDSLTAPINPKNNKPFGFSHFDVCAFPPAS